MKESTIENYLVRRCKEQGILGYKFVSPSHRGNLQPSPEFALRCAEHVLPIFEAQYPDDARPREAIETARAFLNGRATVEDAQAASRAAAGAARSAYATADFSEDGSHAKKFAAAYAAYAVDAAVYAAAYAAVETATLCANNAAFWATSAANAFAANGGAAERDWQHETLLSLVPDSPLEP